MFLQGDIWRIFRRKREKECQKNRNIQAKDEISNKYSGGYLFVLSITNKIDSEFLCYMQKV